MSHTDPTPRPARFIAEDGGIIATGDVKRMFGFDYVEYETLQELISYWRRTVARPSEDWPRDDLAVLLGVDGDGNPLAHVLELDDLTDLWGVPDLGWYPLAWTIDYEETTA